MSDTLEREIINMVSHLPKVSLEWAKAQYGERLPNYYTAGQCEIVMRVRHDVNDSWLDGCHAVRDTVTPLALRSGK